MNVKQYHTRLKNLAKKFTYYGNTFKRHLLKMAALLLATVGRLFAN